MNQNKNWKKAETAIKSALKIESQHGDYRYLLALIYQEQGRTIESNALMQQLQSGLEGIQNKSK